jgi:hypothetical protein
MKTKKTKKKKLSGNSKKNSGNTSRNTSKKEIPIGKDMEDVYHAVQRLASLIPVIVMLDIMTTEPARKTTTRKTTAISSVGNVTITEELKREIDSLLIWLDVLDLSESNKSKNRNITTGRKKNSKPLSKNTRKK